MTKKITQNSLFSFILFAVGFTNINISNAQTTGFTMPSSAYVSTPVQMINSNPTGFTSHQWDIEDNGSIEYTTTDATHIFTTVGVHCIRLFGQNATKRDSVLKCINITKPTGVINDLIKHAIVNVFPNPSSGVVNISYQCACSESMEIKIYNSTGVLVHSFIPTEIQNGIQSIDLSHESNGLYFVRIIGSDNQISRIFSLNK